ncbi:MAG: DUF2752 domain-containing protein [Fluviicola sp.]|jgi:hypothetical protein
MLPCSWKESFGVECPSCGAQRSFFSLIAGDIVSSLILFPALLPLLFTVLWVALHLIWPQRFAAKWIVRGVVTTGGLMLISWLFKIFTTYI